MGLLDWLLGKKRDTPPLDVGPLPPFRWDISPPVPTSSRVVSQAGDSHRQALLRHEAQIHILYARSGQDTPTRRRIVPLLASPEFMVTAVDLDRNRVRTYRIDRMSDVSVEGSAISTAPKNYFLSHAAPDMRDLIWQSDNQETIARLKKAMLPQISILVLLARFGAKGMTPQAFHLISDYIPRDARFAVRNDFVPRGSKADLWPVLRDWAYLLTPDRRFLTAFVATLNEDWESGRRFEHLNTTAAAICKLDAGPTSEQRAMVNMIELAGK